MNIYLDGFKGNPSAFGLGETIHTYEDRHKGGDYGKSKQDLAAVGSARIKRGWWTDFDGRDHEIHTWLKKQRGITQTGRETYKIEEGHGLSIDVVKDLIEEEFFTDNVEEKEYRKLRKHQQEFVSEITSTWDEWKEYLLFAKCRAGKSTMVLSSIVESGVKVSLVVSYRNSPKQSWRDDSQEFKNFDNIIFIDIRDGEVDQFKSEIEYWMGTDKQIVLYSTIQAPNRYKNLPCNIDLIVFDEAHLGYEGDQWISLRDHFDTKVLYVSGTAHKILEDFPKFRFVYSYFEEQLYKLQGIKEYENSPQMRLILAKYESSKYQDLYGDDPDAMGNIFRVNKDEDDFAEPILVDEFMSKVFTQDGIKYNKRILKNCRHIMITLPSMASCHALVDYFKSTRFKPLVVTSDTRENSETIRSHIDTNTSTVILTKTANVLGLTAEGIDTVMNCAEGSSREQWTQFAFRGGSTKRNSWDVIDFCPERCFTTIRNMYFTACDLNHELTESEYELLDLVPIFEYFSDFEEVTPERLNEILSNDVDSAISLISGIVSQLDFLKLGDIEFDSFQKSAKLSSWSSFTVNENNANAKSNKKLTSSSKFSTHYDKSEIAQKTETIQAYMERIGLVIFHMIKNKSTPKSVDGILNSKYYEQDTGDTTGIIKACLEQKIIPKSWINRINQGIIDIEHSMSKDECGTLQKLATTRKNQKTLSLDILDRMVPSKKYATEKLYIHGDPSGLHSLYAIENKSWEPDDIVVWENDPTHRYAIKQINAKINVTDNLSNYKMQFSATVGNPPYTDTSTVTGATTGGCAKTLDTHFYLSAMKRSDYVSEVIRSKHFAKSTSKFRRTLFSTPGIVSIEALSPDTFPSISMTETCICTWKRGYTGLTKLTYLDGTVKNIQLTDDTCIRFTNPDFVSDVPNNMGHRYQRGDLNLNQLIEGEYPMITTMGGKNGEMQITNVDKSQYTCCVNQHGVVMNSKYGGQGFGQIRIKPYDHAISGSTVIIKTSSEEESNKIADYLRSDEVHQMVLKNRIVNTNSKELFRTIPDIL